MSKIKELSILKEQINHNRCVLIIQEYMTDSHLTFRCWLFNAKSSFHDAEKTHTPSCTHWKYMKKKKKRVYHTSAILNRLVYGEIFDAAQFRGWKILIHSAASVSLAPTHPCRKKKEKIARFRRREKNVYVHIEVKMEVIFLYYVYTHTWYPHVLFPPPKLTPRNPPLESTPVPFHEPTHRNHPHEPSPWRTVQGDDMAAVEDGADIVLKEIVRHEMPFTTHNYWRKKGIFLFFLGKNCAQIKGNWRRLSWICTLFVCIYIFLFYFAFFVKK